MKRDLYFKELAVVLGRAGFTPLPQGGVSQSAIMPDQ